MIPVNEPRLDGRELEYVSECLNTGWISSAGRFISEFEDSWAARCNRRYGVAVCNGTVALQLAVAALNLGPGDEVIMPSFTIISCAMAVVYQGALPVLVDADPVTWGMDVAAVAARITPRTRAIMPVHIYGHPVDMDPLLELAKKHGLAIIEDAAEAHAAQYLSHRDGPDPEWRVCGSFGDVSCFSFYANKLVTTGEGGMVVTDDEALAKRLRLLRNLAFVPSQRFLHDELGFNFRMTNVQAAIGLAQVERIDETVVRKRRIGARYLEALGSLPGIRWQVEQPWAKSVWWMNGFVLEKGTGHTAVSMADRLKLLGVETRPFFLGMDREPALRERGLFAGETYPITTELADMGLYLPSGVGLTEEQQETVITAVNQVLA
ncbi:MAG TPA: DegT/DnrJ/EryC1/StrS family aminotransferase [Candidatus Limnocylindrales bacterium]